MIRTLVVDAEPISRKRILHLLAAEKGFAVIAACSTGSEALETIVREQPDLVVLEVQLPEMDGFALLQALADSPPVPAVVFVTTNRQHAARAFDAHALDFLVKPIEHKRFLEALARARDSLERDRVECNGHDQGQAGGSLAGQRRRYASRFAVRCDSRIIFVDTSSIEWIEAAGNYVRLHAAGNQHLMRSTISGLQRRLDPERFVRVHRSAVVNLDYVREVYPWFHGDNAVVMQDGTRVSLSRSYRQELLDQVDRTA